MEHSHSHHGHDHHDDSAEAFAPAAENLLLGLAGRAQAGRLDLTELPGIDELAEIEAHYDIANIKARLGDAYPALGFGQEAAVIAAFAQNYAELPTEHARYAHDHHDNHEHHDGCGKTHGPIRKAMESFERKVLGRIRNQRVRMVAAAAFRGSSLILCPGDDLAAIGLQVYGAFTGHTGHDHEHAEHQAILPRRPRIDFGKGTAIISLPLDTPLPHGELPHTPAGDLVRGMTLDPEPPQLLPESAAQPERPRRLRKVALLGLAAAAFAGIFMAGTQGDAPGGREHPVAAAPGEVPPPPKVESEPLPEPAPAILRTVTAKKGDSQWAMVERQTRQTLGRKGRVPLINALTHFAAYHNADVAPRPGSINDGQEVDLPTDAVIRAFNKALEDPAQADPRLVADVRKLNEQAGYNSPGAVEVLKGMEGYFVGATR
ncbi:MAG TPA: hypothetical protein VJM32_04970 [Candidatus Saccharimonadales bacterium]|nr:hypothetical protein [Candidatus Saccharimonadales bacterium]